MREKKEIGKKIAAVIFTLCFLSIAQKSEAQSGQINGKNWKVDLSGKFIYEDNVILSPRNSSNRPAGLPGRDGDEAFEFSVQGRYKFNLSDTLNLAADYSLDNTNYIHLSQYDLQTHTFGTDAAYFIPNTGNKIWRLNLRYFYMHNLLNKDSYNGINYISPSVMFMINRKLGFTRINYTFTNEDNHATSLRDTDSHSFGIDHYYFIFGNPQRRIRVGYAYRNDEARGTLINDLNSHTFKIELKTLLIWEIFLNAKYRYKGEDYDTRAVLIGTGIRDDDQHNFTVEFSRELIKDLDFHQKLTGFIKYQHTANYSTDKLHDHDENVVSLMVKGRF